jgi:hypothetical protein
LTVISMAARPLVYPIEVTALGLQIVLHDLGR